MKRESGVWEGNRLVEFAPLGVPPTGAEWFFARWCALECVRLWDAPQIVIDYLESGDPDLASPRPRKTLENPMFSGQFRPLAASTAWWWKDRRQGRYPGTVDYDPGFEGARMSAAYSASGFINAAAEWSMSSLAWDARRSISRENPDLPLPSLMEAQKRSRECLASVFKETAVELYRSERYA